MKKSLKKILLEFIKLIFFNEHHKEKIKVDKNGCEYILFRIDVYFTEYFLAVEIDEQSHEGRELILRKKEKKHQKKNLVTNLLELIQVMQKEAMILAMNSTKYKYLSVNLNTKKKELEDKIKKLKLQLTLK